jgi:hypothetical protein
MFSQQPWVVILAQKKISRQVTEGEGHREVSRGHSNGTIIIREGLNSITKVSLKDA